MGDLSDIPGPLRAILLAGYAWGIVLRIGLLAVGIAFIVIGDTLARLIGVCLVAAWFGIAIWYVRGRRARRSAAP